MITFADLMSLLVSFFVLLFATTTVERHDWERVVLPISEYLTGHRLEGKGAALTVLEPAFSTKDATGSILVTVLGMVAEMERKFIRERQQSGIEAAKGRGVYKGRKPTAPVERVRELHAQGMGPTAIAKELGLSRMHVYRLTRTAPT